jgi:hypothetical protein
MSTAWLNLLMDSLVALLLLAAIPSFLILSRRLKNMQMGQDGMRQLIEGLNIATEQARRAISDMKLAAAHSTQDLDAHTKSARQMADELALMIEAGDNLANKLENVIANGRLQPANVPAHAQATPVSSRRAPASEDDFGDDFADDRFAQTAKAPLSQPRGAQPLSPRNEAERDLLNALKTIR